MVSLITLAHRVSTIHAGYADIHAAVFPSSLSWLINRSTRLPAQHCEHEQALQKLSVELACVYEVVRAENAMKLSSTFDHEFTDLLAKYIQALSDANDKLADICHHLCQESRGIEPYGERESREARIAYDQAIQHYQRLGQRLSRLYERL